MNHSATARIIGLRMETRYADQQETSDQAAPVYNTVVYNCDCHSFNDVTFGLMRIVGTGLRDAELKAKEIDFFGSGVVATGSLEIAELYAFRLRDEVVSVHGTKLKTSVERA